MTEEPIATKQHPMPFCRIEVVVMSLIDGRLQVMLARRAEAPHAGKWALPGGVLRIDADRSLDAAAQRVMYERMGIELPFLRQLCTVGGPTRDPRAPWALSVVYRALTDAGEIKPVPGKRIQDLAWRPADETAADKSLAFDHAQLIERAVVATRDECPNNSPWASCRRCASSCWAIGLTRPASGGGWRTASWWCRWRERCGPGHSGRRSCIGWRLDRLLPMQELQLST